MNKKLRKIYILIVVLLYLSIVVLGAVTFLGKKDYSLKQKENSYLIGASYMTMNNEFYEILSEEISNRIEIEEDRLILRDPALDAQRQIDQIDEMIDLGIDVLVVTPVEWDRLTDVLNKAKQQGIYIVVVDSDLEDESLADCTITSDNYSAGCMVGAYFLEQNEKAELIVMTHDETRSGQDRVRGFLDTVEQNPDIHVVRSVECYGQLEIAMPRMQDMIDEGVEFDNVFCLNDLASVGVVAALDENQMLDGVGVYGVDASPDAKALIKEGMMSASAAQFPSQIGQMAADVIYQLLAGESVEKHISVPVELVTKDNVEQFRIDRWQ